MRFAYSFTYSLHAFNKISCSLEFLSQLQIPRQIQTISLCLLNLSSARKTFTLITSRYYTYAIVLHQPLNLHHFLQLSVTHHSLSLTQQAHAQVLTHGLQQNPFLATNLISTYALCGNPTKSKLVFHSVELKSVYLWNSLMNGYVRNFVYNEASSYPKKCVM